MALKPVLGPFAHSKVILKTGSEFRRLAAADYEVIGVCVTLHREKDVVRRFGS